ncbi:MAG: S8 family serine peptidase, partial [Candidatus Paceibacterota bacterium]
MKRKTLRKLFAGFMVLSIIFGQIGMILPILGSQEAKASENLSFETKRGQLQKSIDAQILDKGIVTEKLKTEELNKLNDNKTADQKISGQYSESLSKTEKSENLGYVPGEVLVKFRNNKINLNTSTGRAAALNLSNLKSLEKKEDLRKNNISVLRIKDSKTVEQKIAELKTDPNVEYAEPNYMRYLTTIDINDIYKDNLWGLDNSGQNVNGITGIVDADIDVPEAWAINEGVNDSVIVAVIDDGIAYNHPDLLANMWDGTNCKDESGNFLGGCNHGYDYQDNDKIPLPTSGSHGTHIAGTIGAVKNNSKGIVGVAPNVKIMAVKFRLDIASEIKAIDFAINNDARIINASFSGADFSQSEYDAINRFKKAGGIFVAAAGNGGADGVGDNNDSNPQYPADYALDNIISVAATDSSDNLASFSNYGVNFVDVGAPGVNILSTIAEGNVFKEDFEGAIYGVGGGGITQSYWGIANDGSSKVVYSDSANYPYAPNAHTWLMPKDALDLVSGGATSANISFVVWCDTPDTLVFDDYIQTSYLSNGTWFNSKKYNEDSIYLDGGYPWTDSGHLGYYKKYTEDISKYLSSDFKFSFDWITNSSVDSNWGCTIDNIKITKYTDGSEGQYDYKNGTSMAAPHVAGLAALIWGYKPLLSYSEVKNTILTTGDSVASLSGKTVTGKRINAYKALNSLSEEKPPYAVAIDNQKNARPISGINEAN